MKRQEGNLMDFIMSDFTCEKGDNEYVIEKGKSKFSLDSSCLLFGTTNCIIIKHEPPSHLNLHNVFPQCWDKVTTANEKNKNQKRGEERFSACRSSHMHSLVK